MVEINVNAAGAVGPAGLRVGTGRRGFRSTHRGRGARPLVFIAALLALASAGCSLAGGDDDDGARSASTAVEPRAVEAQGDDQFGDPADRAGSALPADKTDGSAPDLSSEVGEILVQDGADLAGADLEAYLAARYKAYWQAFDRARTVPTERPDLDYPELANLAAGELLDTSFQQIRQLHLSGQAIVAPETAAVPGLSVDQIHRVRIEGIDGGVAQIHSCVVNDQVRYELAGGAIVSDSVITVRAESTMAKADGTWKVVRSSAVAIDDGVGGCWTADDYQY